MSNVEYPVDALVSYHYFQRDEDMNTILKPRGLRLIADSGAFSAYTQGTPIDLDEYATWCRRWRPYLYWIAALDVFGQPEETLANFRHLRDHHGLDTVPTIHVGAATHWIDVYAKEGVDFMGLGGMVGLGPRVVRWLVHVLRYARDHHPQMRFHAWGLTTPNILEKVPIYSADSSGLLAASYRYGRLKLYDPTTRRHVGMALNGREPYGHHKLLASYNTTPQTVATSHKGNRDELIRLCAASTQSWARHLQQRHQVSPPTWSVNPNVPHVGDSTEVTGPRLHMVETDTRDFTPLLGPRLHLVDAAPQHLNILGEGTSQ